MQGVSRIFFREFNEYFFREPPAHLVLAHMEAPASFSLPRLQVAISISAFGTYLLNRCQDANLVQSSDSSEEAASICSNRESSLAELTDQEILKEVSIDLIIGDLQMQ